MQLKQIMKRAVALVLVLSLLMSLSACGTAEVISTFASMVGINVDIVPGERLPNSPWINSDLEGSIDETTELNLKDDFHTAANRDWLLETVAEGNALINSFAEIDTALVENERRLMTPGTEFEPDPEIMSQETLDHLLDLIWGMMDLAGNQDKRNELGVEPLRPYLDAIAQIDSLEEMTEYLKNADGMNITGENFFNFGVDRPYSTRDYYTVHIQYPMHKMLQDFQDYIHMGISAYMIFRHEQTAIAHVLEELGYTSIQIKKLIMDAYTFESSMAHIAPWRSDITGSTYWNRGDKIYTLEDIREIQGNFPLTELLEADGVAHSETFRVYEPALLNYMGSYYKERNLDKFKAYFTIHTVLEALPYLDKTCRELNQNIQNAKKDYEGTGEVISVGEPDPSDPEAVEAAKLADLYSNYITPLLAVPYQLAYIGSYCSSEAKQDILNMLEDIRTYYIQLLDTTEWLSPETREKAIEKMQKMHFRVMYPDVLPDYSGLVYQNYEDGGNLLDAVAAINKRNNTTAVEKINQPVDRSYWSLRSMPTTVVNAYNEGDLNSIVILSGILAGDFMYDENAPVEQNYARLGTILGHEITHSFDTTGYTRDAEGLPYGWWTNEDEVAFRQKADKLVSYYTSMSAFPGLSTPYDGQLIQTEAISDMGGMKCMLALAEEIPDFDYDLFFRSYAAIWRTQTSIAKEMEMVKDVHPLHFLRTNVTLQQFDKFFETYDIGPGDGMYLAPEDRILVW